MTSTFHLNKKRESLFFHRPTKMNRFLPKKFKTIQEFYSHPELLQNANFAKLRSGGFCEHKKSDGTLCESVPLHSEFVLTKLLPWGEINGSDTILWTCLSCYKQLACCQVCQTKLSLKQLKINEKICSNCSNPLNVKTSTTPASAQPFNFNTTSESKNMPAKVSLIPTLSKLDINTNNDGKSIDTKDAKEKSQCVPNAQHSNVLPIGTPLTLALQQLPLPLPTPQPNSQAQKNHNPLANNILAPILTQPPSYRNYYEYMKSREWQEFRYQVLICRANSLCEEILQDTLTRCTRSAVHVHHTQYYVWTPDKGYQDTTNNLVALCEHCHEQRHTCLICRRPQTIRAPHIKKQTRVCDNCVANLVC